MSLTQQQIEDNKMKFLKLISEINIPEADTQGLVEFLDNSDFFTAPASTVYHCNYAGGLCEHSLNVYDSLCKLYELYKENIPEIDPNSLLITGLLHDISKANFYESHIINKKIYSEKGSKSDNQGTFDWFSESAYKVRDAKDRFLFGTHGQNSMMLLSKYIPLSIEEAAAITNHMGLTGVPSMDIDLSAINNKYPLLTLLHSADFLSCFLLEANK